MEYLYTKAAVDASVGNAPRAREARYANHPVTSRKQADVEALAQAIRTATETEIDELAGNLLNTDDSQLFGHNEFTIRALAHKIAAKAIEHHLARKKTATRGPA